MRIPFEKKYLYIFALFVFIRIIYGCGFGISYDIRPITNFVNFIDRELIETDLLNSLFFSHSQPPLYNLFAGTVIKISNGDAFLEVLYFKIIFLAMGFLISLFLYILMKEMGVPPGPAFFIVFIQLINPSYVLYENTVISAYPSAFLICLSTLLLLRFSRDERPAFSFLFFLSLAALALIHSMFHVIWMAFIFAALVFLKNKCRKVLLLTFLLPFALVVSVCVKNLYVFGFFGTSSWLGMSMAKMTSLQLRGDLKARLIQEGFISKLAYVRPFSALPQYRAHLKSRAATGVPVLDKEIKSSGGRNLNNVNYLEISRIYLKDALKIIINYPSVYCRGIIWAFYYYFVPPDDYFPLYNNRDKIISWAEFFDKIAYGRFRNDDILRLTLPDARPYIPNLRLWLNSGLFIIIYFIAILVYGYKTLKENLFSDKIGSPQNITLIFIIFNIIFVTFAGNLFEIGENNRFRFFVDPLYLICIGLIISRIKRHLFNKDKKFQNDNALK